MKKLVVFVAALALLASCSTTSIVTDSAKNIDFTNYQTFRVEYQPNEGTQQINALNAKRVEDAIQSETLARGLSEAEEADLSIVWGVGIDVQKNYTTHSTYHGHGGYGYRGRYGGYGFSSGYSDTREYKTTNGTLQMALIDNNTNEMLWLGTASGEIKGKSKNADEKINSIIEKVFAEFPLEKYS